MAGGCLCISSSLQTSILRAVTRQLFEVALEQKAPIVFSSHHGRDQTLPLQFERFFFFNDEGGGIGLQSDTL